LNNDNTACHCLCLSTIGYQRRKQNRDIVVVPADGFLGSSRDLAPVFASLGGAAGGTRLAVQDAASLDDDS
jgi:hypothetical protein